MKYHQLEREGCIVDYYDPYMERYDYKGQNKEGIKELSNIILSNVDLVIVTTAHSNIDYNFV